MAKKNPQFVDYEDSEYDEENEVSNGDSEEEYQDDSDTAQANKVATWRKIEDFWDNYKLNKRINDDPYNDKYFDYLLDGETN